MFNKHFSRREFLKYSMIATGALTSQAFRPFYYPLDEQRSNNIARVTTESISVYSEPSDKSRILYQRTRDELINIYDEVISDDGPAYNPLWYRVWSGYVHSAYLQRVEIKFNPVQKNIPETGVLAEITVPLTQSMRLRKPYGWEPLYRLYYQSTHWITAVEEGPDGNLWYKLLDELLEVNYHVPAEHLRIIPPDELLPITPEIPSHKKRIEVSIGYQTVRAFEYDQLVFETKMSSGVPNRNPDPDAIPTDTPKGKFNIQSKMPSKHMGDGRLTSELFAYELPGVPWSCFFEPKTGVAFHGTYWHYNYGLQMSHGCVNLKPEEAKWIFRWSTPIADASTIETRGFGTPVIVT
jgi:lipoprotein-anchoring transpeptidase ErfK/SrfK